MLKGLINIISKNIHFVLKFIEFYNQLVDDMFSFEFLFLNDLDLVFYCKVKKHK